MSDDNGPRGGVPVAEAERAAAPPAASPRRDFGLLWVGQSLSLLGDQFMVLALPLLAVTVLGATPAQAALLPFGLYVPFLVLGLPAGAIVDRLSRRSTMILCDLARCGVFAMVAALAAAGRLTFPTLLVLVAVSGVATVFFQVAYTSFLPSLFSAPTELQRGNARLFFSESLARSLGPMLCGPAIAFAGVVWAVAANAASFLLSAGSVRRIRTRESLPPPRTRERGWILRDVREGLDFTFQHPHLEPVILCGVVYVLFLSVVEAALVLYARDVLKLDAVGIGVVLGATAVGFPLGNLLSSRLVSHLGVAMTLVVGASVSVCGLVCMPVAGALGSTVGFVGASVLHGVGEGAFGPCALTLRQTVTPAALLGRVNAVQRFFLWGATPFGSLLASFMISLGGLPTAMWVGGVGTVACLPLLLRRGIRRALWPSGSGVALVAGADASN